jgi:hypothetical protein
MTKKIVTIDSMSLHTKASKNLFYFVASRYILNPEHPSQDPAFQGLSEAVEVVSLQCYTHWTGYGDNCLGQ